MGGARTRVGGVTLVMCLLGASPAAMAQSGGLSDKLDNLDYEGS